MIYRKDYRLPDYWVDTVDLEVTLHDDHATVVSQLAIKKRDVTQKAPLVLAGEQLILEGVQLDGRQLSSVDYTVTDKQLTIQTVPDVFRLMITTRIFPAKNTALSGLYRSKQTYCTQCEAEGFRRITYFLDRPDVLSRYTTKIVADRRTCPLLLSNGNLIASGELPNHQHWAMWQDPFKKPCYLFALVAGDFEILEDHFTTQSGRKILLQIYVEKGYGDQAEYAMQSLKEAMRWDEVAFGREYDLSQYMIVAISDFNMGAMENKGLNIFNTKYILAKPSMATDEDYRQIKLVIGHEYFHNWSGNRVTCRDWFQLSLKEGLTIFREQLFAEAMFSKALSRIRDVRYLRETQFIEDAGPLAHPVRPEAYLTIDNFYTTTIYEKGAEVLRMLRTILGESLFRKGMDQYFETFDGQAVTIEDFVSTMETVSGLDLTQFRLWYSTAGTPVITVRDQYDSHTQRYQLTLTQNTPPTPEQPIKEPLYIPIRMALLGKNATPLAETMVTLTQATQTICFEHIAEAPVPSLLRHFSAPVKLDYPYTDEALIFLWQHDQDMFNRWEAGQQYLIRILLRLIDAYQRKQTLVVPTSLAGLFEAILNQSQLTPDLRAALLTLPSEKYLAEQMTVIDVEAIHNARECLLQTVAQTLEPVWLKNYYAFNQDRVDERQLKNVCLSYLMLLETHAELGMQQFERALQNNMTDTQAALAMLANVTSALREQALTQFYDVWCKEALMVDKWLTIQATAKLPSTFKQVLYLMHHEAFDMNNPNKVYALVGAFAGRNAVRFHAINGEGYVWLRECVQQLDAINPQVAARMVQPLTMFKRYDKARQQLMKAQLTLLLQNKTLSNNVYELASKSLCD